MQIAKDNKYSAKRLDAIAALQLLATSFNGPATTDRLLTIELAMHVVVSARVFNQQHLEILQGFVLRLQMVSGMRKILAGACNMQWFYWHRSFIPLYLKELLATPEDAHRLPYLFACLQDCGAPLKSIPDAETSRALVDAFQKEVCVWCLWCVCVCGVCDVRVCVCGVRVCVLCMCIIRVVCVLCVYVCLCV